ncbi:MAG TPA: glycosyltransferase family 9 protein [Bacteroidales bacterium]
MKTPERIIISRTDSIGDVVLTLPLAGFLKSNFPKLHILFLAKNYTREVVELSSAVDEFVSWDEISQLPSEAEKVEKLKNLKADAIIHVFPRQEIASLAKKAGIRNRIGASGRLYHYFTCNKIVPLSRRNSNLHEAQLNLQLLKPIFKDEIPSLDSIPDFYQIKKPFVKNNNFDEILDPKKFNLILHPKSKGSAREWPLEKYAELVEILPKDNFKIFVTGTIEEGELIQDFLVKNKNSITNLTGKFTLIELISFIAQADGLVAASTGPLHIAAMLDKLAIGIYPPIKPMHPGRWAPIGKNAYFLVAEKDCNKCRKGGECSCMNMVNTKQVKELIEQYAGKIKK